ncbi:MAG: 50S ribosomal protein L21 [Candidatus Saccharibacteria bacterium]|nr:50S ribosomal protein L21 [Candidatus Saccharibacteria bacterium]
MKKAVISTGGKQYVVSEGDELNVELLKDAKKTASFDVLLLVEDGKTSVGTPLVKNAKVQASVLAADEQQEKVSSIRYKPKKRVRTVKGHRQRQSRIKITKITK